MVLEHVVRLAERGVMSRPAQSRRFPSVKSQPAVTNKASTPRATGKSRLRGNVKPSFGSNLDEKMRGKTWFQAVARTQGNGVEIPLVAVKSLCRLCGKVMPPIGTSRVNGADHSDWMTRNYHKSCLKA